MEDVYEITLKIQDSDIDMDLNIDTTDVDMDLSVESNDIQMYFEEAEIVVGGTKNYNELFNIPTFNGTELKGDMNLEDVGGVDEENYMSLAEIDHLFRTL